MCQDCGHDFGVRRATEHPESGCTPCQQTSTGSGPCAKRLPPVEIVDAMTLQPGDMIRIGGVNITILRERESGVETVAPLAGRPCIKFWACFTDNGKEGYLTYGPGGVVRLVTRGWQRREGEHPGWELPPSPACPEGRQITDYALRVYSRPIVERRLASGGLPGLPARAWSVQWRRDADGKGWHLPKYDADPGWAVSDEYIATHSREEVEKMYAGLPPLPEVAWEPRAHQELRASLPERKAVSSEVRCGGC
jgi:hypothetical protein